MRVGQTADRAALERKLKSLEGLTPERVLGVVDSARADDIRAAYLDAVKRFHPNRFAREDPEVRGLASEIFIRVKKAYEVLSDPSRRVPTTPTVTPAARAITMTTTPLAAPPVRAAAAPPAANPAPAARVGTGPGAGVAPTARPGAPSTQPPRGSAPGTGPGAGFLRPGVPRSAAELSHITKQREERLAKALADSAAGHHADARKSIYSIATEDPQEKKYRVHLYTVWGHELRAEGKLEEALKQYERALALDAVHDEARRAFAELEAQKKAGKGFWKSLLGR